MKIIKKASAGTFESSDAFIEITPSENGVNIEVESVVLKQFGTQIRAAVAEVLQECGVSSADVGIKDFGAIDCVLRARVHTAVLRGCEGEQL